MRREFAGTVAILFGVSACASNAPESRPSEGAGSGSSSSGASSTSPPTSGQGTPPPSGQTSGSAPTGGNPGGGTSGGGTVPQDDAGNASEGGADEGGTGSPSLEGGSTTTSVEPILPAASGTCPKIATGFVTVSGISVQVWAGTKSETPAPMIVYWHATGTNSSEAVGGIGMPQAVADEITGEGGVIVSPSTSTGKGMDTGDAVWYTGDFAIADQLVACAFQQYNLDSHRIYSEGGSAGALQAGTMLFQRSNYIAAVLPNSGGYTIGGMTFQNPKHVPNIMTMHGAKGVDVVIVDFSQQSLYEDGVVVKAGGFAVDCNTGGGHVGASDALKTNGWQFLKDHPFGVSPEPYAKGLPSSFPTSCKIITAADAIPNPV